MAAPIIIVGDELLNRSFEDAAPIRWSPVAGGVLSSDRSGSPAALDGDATGKLVATVAGDGFYQNVVPTIKTLNSQPWVFQVFGRAASGTQSHEARIRYYDASGAQLGTDAAQTTVNATSWTRVAVNGTVPADNVAEVRCEVTQQSGASTTSYWDLAYLGRRVDLTHKLAVLNHPESAVLTRRVSESGRLEVRRLYATLELEGETYPESTVDTQFGVFWDLVSRGQTFTVFLDRADTSEGVFSGYYSSDDRLRRTRLAGGQWVYAFGGWKVAT